MKKLFMGLLAISSMAIMSCSQEEEQLAMYGGTFEDFTGEIITEGTRTSMGEGGCVLWSEADAISLFKKTGYHQKYAVKTAGTTSTTFKYDAWSSEQGATQAMHYAAYPFAQANAISGTTLTLDLSSLATQTYTANTFENAKAVMVAKSETTELAFTNAFSLANVQLKVAEVIPGDDVLVSSIKVESATLPLAGEATVDMSLNKPAAVFAAEGVKSITLAIDAPVKLTETATSFYILMPVATFPANDLTITIQATIAGEAKEYSVTMSDDVEFLRSQITTLTKTIEADEWSGSTEVIVIPEVADVTAANAVLKTQTGVQIAAITADDKITIPAKSAESAAVAHTIDLSNATLPAGDVTISVETTDGEAVKELNVVVAEAKDAAKLIINAPSTTVTITTADGTVIESIEATTAEQTLIIGKGVKVNSLDIKKGNVELYGEVGNIKSEVASTITLMDDITLTSPICVEKGEITLDLGNYTITTGNQLYVDGGVSAAICVKGGKLTIKGNGTIDTYENDDYAVEVRGGELNIEGGTYKGSCTAAYAVTGTINIKGGEFTIGDGKHGTYDYAYVLNLKDANGKDDTAKINVTGGKFYKFDPSDNKSENPGKDYVAVGYSSVASGDYYEVSEGIKNEVALAAAVAAGGDITLAGNITLTSPIYVEKEVTLDLGNHTITTGNQLYVKEVVSAAICVKENGKLTIKGNGTIDTYENDDYAVEVRGGELNIEGGTYKGSCTAAYAVTGTINIKGGEFTIGDGKHGTYDYAYVLNLKDANGKDGTAKINVTGGKFYKFDPSKNKSENPGKDYVAVGYSSVASGDYYEVSEGIKNEVALAAAVAAGGNITLAGNITLTSPIYVETEVTLNLGNHTITTGNQLWVKEVVSAAICVKENGKLTIKGNGTIDAYDYDDYAVEVRGGELNIEGGTYKGSWTAAYAVNGTINISGGEFIIGENEDGDYRYVLNLQDDNGKAEKAKIIVTGGKFYKFDPSNNNSENPSVNYVAAGYSVVRNDDYYEVK